MAFVRTPLGPLGVLILTLVLLPSHVRSAPADNGTRKALIARAQVWMPTDIPNMDIKAGPGGPGAFPFHATVTCDYSDKKLSGLSPKFACVFGNEDEVKVKYGGTNGEVYAEVAATRLLWALGFGADAMYPVRVICRGCPSTLHGALREDTGEYVFDPAAIERKMPGVEWTPDAGWPWKELDVVDESAGASRTHRDALKLMAVFLQHSDTKRQQQRLLCLDEPQGEAPTTCAHPFMMINDLGLTFGRANKMNSNSTAGMNLTKWSRTPVWEDSARCVGDLDKSFTGTLDDPVISEAGRRFLADLLVQLSDQQIHDLFATARVTLRARTPGDAQSGFPTVEEWVQAFKNKRDQIVNRRCA